MKGSSQFFLTVSAAVALSACGTRSSVVVQPTSRHTYPAASSPTPHAGGAAVSTADSYRVVKGDTLYSIAFRHGKDFRELASWNGIEAPYTIWPGQVLTLSPGHASGSIQRPVASTGTTAPASPEPVFQPVPPPNPVPPAPVAPLPATPVASASVHNAPTATSPTAAASVPVAGVAVTTPPPPPAPSTAVPDSSTRSIGGIHWRWPASGQVIKGFKSGDAIPGIEIAGPAGSAVRAAADGVVVYSGNGLVGYGELVIVKHNDSFLSAYGHNRKRLVKEGQRVTAGQEIAEMGATGASRDELQFQIRRDGNPVNPLDYLPSR